MFTISTYGTFITRRVDHHCVKDQGVLEYTNTKTTQNGPFIFGISPSGGAIPSLVTGISREIPPVFEAELFENYSNKI